MELHFLIALLAQQEDIYQILNLKVATQIAKRVIKVPATNCTSCPTESAIYLISTQTPWTCSSNCPNGYYGETSTITCVVCNINCLTCDGATSSKCMTCQAGKFLSSFQCLPCDSNIKTCSQSAINCTSCQIESFFFLICSQTPWTCSSTCPDGYYGEMSTFTCNPCNPSCLTCNGLTSLNCLNCQPGNFLSSSQCLPCDSICKTCINSANNCTSCPTESVIYLISTQTPWTCSSTCPDGYYGETSTITCVACSNCKTYDLSIKNCTSCDSGKFLISSQTNWTCDTNCPFGYYGDTSLNTCKICDKNCETCNGSTSAHCITCKSGYYILSGICKVCDSKCATCMTLSTTCFSCPTTVAVTSLF